MLLDKYKPLRITEILGQDIAVKKLLDSLRNWKKGRAIILFGASGTGKTASLYAVAKENNMELIEIDTLDSKRMEPLMPAIKQPSLFGKKKLIAIESADRMKQSLISEIVKNSIYPVFLIVENPYIPKLRAVRYYSDIIEFKKVPIAYIEKKLMELNKKENFNHPANVLRNIAESSEGDMRAAIIDLENFVGERDLEQNIFNALSIVFKSRSMLKAKGAIDSCDKGEAEIFRWLEENIMNEFSDPSKRARAFEILSKADLFTRRCRRAVDMATGLSTVGAEKTYTSYKPPPFFFTKKHDFSLLAKKMHCSQRKIGREIGVMKTFVKV